MATTPDDTVELRGPCPREIVDVLDAFSTARRLSRTELVNQILGKWVAARLHEQMILGRVSRGNPKVPEPSWNDTET